MDTFLEKLETLIDDVERDENMTRADLISALYKLKEEIEDYNLGKEERTLEWEDLD